MTMVAGRWALWKVVAAVLLVATPGLAYGIGTVHFVPPSAAPGPSGATAAPGSGAAAVAHPAHSAISDALARPLSSDNAAVQAADNALAAAKAAGVNRRDVFVPRPSASAEQAASSVRNGIVSPLYAGTPAPMGVADFGLSALPNGSVNASVQHTSSLLGTVNISSTGIWGGDLFQSSPDSFGIQLNAVTTNVTLFGTGGYEFWTQDVVEYLPASGLMVLVTNVWNFSDRSGALSPNAFYAHGPYGHQVGTTFYYAELVLPVALSYPLTITLGMTSNVTVDNVSGAARDSVYFTVDLTGPSVTANFAGPLNLTYDYVVFNSTPAGNPSKVAAPSPYTANGEAYNPLGLTNDWELVLGGPGGGSHVDLTAADATMGLDFWNGSAYVPVPSALNYGGETGETASGVSIGWSNQTGGPAGFPVYANVSEGPTILQGLWNTTTPQGTFPVTFNMTPSNAFVLVDPTPSERNFTVPEAGVAAGAFGTTFELSPGDYGAVVELSDHTPVTVNFTVDDVAQTINVTLVANASAGLYTPLWATSNAQLAAISSGGNGTPSNPYRLDTGATASLGPEFGLYNDFTFPVYPGVFLQGTNASVVINDEPSLRAATNTFQYPGPYLPASNSLQWWFWNVSNVVVANTTFAGGRFGASTFGPISFDTFNVIFYASGHNLVWNDTFATPTQGLLFFQGGAYFGPSTGAGGDNVVWGSRFYETIPTTTCPAYPTCLPSFDYQFGLGVEVAEGNDTFVNNYFGTPTTAWELPLDLYSANPMLFADRWNITTGSILPTLANFPQFPFSGPNILGGAAQGGNFWWDYGSTLNVYNGADNPVGSLPYVENATTLLAQVLGCAPYYCASYLYPGGDFAPLTDGLVAVTFHATGTPRFAPWGLVLLGFHTPFPAPGGAALAIGTQGLAGLGDPTLLVFPGVYLFSPAFQGQAFGRAMPTGLNITGPLTLKVPFRTLAGYSYLSFRESGLPAGTLWSTVVTIAGTPYVVSSTARAIVWLLPHGSYPYFVPEIPGYYPSYGMSPITLNGGAAVAVHFHPFLYAVSFSESGLALGKPWTVVVSGTIAGHARRMAGHSTGSTISFQLPNGTYTFAVRPVRGYTLNGTGNGSVVVNGSVLTTVSVVFRPVTYAVTFTETGLPGGTNWSVTVGALTLSSTGTTIVFLETNGTHPYSLGAVAGYTGAGRPSLAFRVAGAPAAVAVTFH